MKRAKNMKDLGSFEKKNHFDDMADGDDTNLSSHSQF